LHYDHPEGYKIQEPSKVRAGMQKYNACSLQEEERTIGSTINNQGGREEPSF
jgi:hypothetical protein